MPRGWPHLSPNELTCLWGLCIWRVTCVMGKTENPFKENLIYFQKHVCPFNNLFVYSSTDGMMEQTISSQGTFLRHLSADNWSWNTSASNTQEEGQRRVHYSRLGWSGNTSASNAREEGRRCTHCSRLGAPMDVCTPALGKFCPP